MSSVSPSCDPAEVARLEKEIAKQPNTLGVGVIDAKTGVIRLFTYEETDAFSIANRNLQAAAGHEAAAVMAGVSPSEARGFILGKQGSDWHVYNQSHLNRVDGQSNTVQMAPQTFNGIVTALQAAGAHNPAVH
jgi:hypothetical protein